MSDRFYKGVIVGAGVLALIVAALLVWLLLHDIRALGVFL